MDGDGPEAEDDAALWAELVDLRRDIAASAVTTLSGWGRGDDDAAVANLAHYLALRHRDIRPLQRRLMWRGLSSLGRLESRVLPALDATISALSARMGRQPPAPAPTEAAFFAGEGRLDAATDAVFGPPSPRRRTRIMVTLDATAGDDPAVAARLVAMGMDLARINCAHDGPDAWRAMAANTRAAAAAAGRTVRVLMDIAGPKVRTLTASAPPDLRLHVGDRFRLTGDDAGAAATMPTARLSHPEILSRIAPGDRLGYDDGKIEGIVEAITDDGAVVRVTGTRAKGTRLKAEKGINLPDTDLGIAPLTAKDETDIAHAVDCADMLGYSFVSRPADLDLLEAVLARFGGRPGIGLVAKVERPDAVHNLPALIARATARRPFAVMIARGDLAAEIGFARVAEMQEEILWLCEAAAVPAIWATQVLEGLVEDGIASRGEMTDAAMGARAECVMLNKGSNVAAAVEVLDRLLCRMDDHVFKKTPMLRALRSW